MTQNRYQQLVNQRNDLTQQLRNERDKCLFITFALSTNWIGKFHLRAFQNFIQTIMPELIENSRMSEGSMDYLYLNGTKDNLISSIQLAMEKFEIKEDHALYNTFIKLINLLHITSHGSIIKFYSTYDEGIQVINGGYK